MEITWTYNFLESIAFIGLCLVGLFLAIKVLVYLFAWLLFRKQ